MENDTLEIIEHLDKIPNIAEIVDFIEEIAPLRSFAEIRDTFLACEGETEYKELLSESEYFLTLLDNYKEQPIEDIAVRLAHLIKNMEDFKVSEKDEEKTELDIMLCCLAIEDFIKRKVKEKAYGEADDGMGYGMGGM